MYKEKKVAVIIAAAGKGTRIGGSVPKQFLEIGGEPILAKTFKAFESMEEVDHIFIVTGQAYIDHCKKIISSDKVEAIVAGGRERQDSVNNAIQEIIKMCPEVEYVLIHDGARPFVSRQVILNVLEGVYAEGAAVPCVPMKDSLRYMPKTVQSEPRDARHMIPRDRDSCVDACGSRSVNRSEFFAVQTPQGFDINVLTKAYEQAFAEGYRGTDDASLVERAGFAVGIVKGDYQNIKITTKEDLPMEYRVGTGFDVHKFCEGRDLILGGITIPYEKGLEGHSDADVLVHALMDALLGAAALGDIGRHFPDTDDSYKGISSLLLLKKVGCLMADEGYSIGNVDVTIIAQEPKIAPYIEKMRNNISNVLCLEKSRINIKGTTTEKLGFTGRKEGIAAEAVCSVYR